VRPKVVLHNAVSADGRIEGFDIDVGRFYALTSTWAEDVTLAGADTILQSGTPADEPAVPPPSVEPVVRKALLAVVDSRGRVRCWDALRTCGYWRDAIALVSSATPEEYLAYLDGRGVEWLRFGDERVDLAAALETLTERFGARVVRADSGGGLNSALLRAGLADEVSLLVHPALAGEGLRSVFRSAPDAAVRLRLTHEERIGDGLVWLRYDVR